MRFITVTILLVILSSSSWANDSYLRRFVGNWAGTYQIKDLTGKELGTHEMEQVNYWIDGQLWGETAVQLPDGSIQKEFSNSYFDNNVAHAIVEGALSKREYWGWYFYQQIWWMSANSENSPHHQFHTETLVPSRDGFELVIDGYQWNKTVENPGFVRVQASLHRVKGEDLKLFEF